MVFFFTRVLALPILALLFAGSNILNMDILNLKMTFYRPDIEGLIKIEFQLTAKKQS